MTQSKVAEYSPMVARILLASLFLVSGVNMALNFGGTVGYFAAVGIPMAAVVLVLVLIIKIGGGLMLATGVHAREAAWALIVFTALTIVIAHLGEGQMVQAFKNLSIIGGLLLVTAHGAGNHNCKKYCPCPRCKKGGAAAAGMPAAQASQDCNSCGICDDCTRKTAESALVRNSAEGDGMEDSE